MGLFGKKNQSVPINDSKEFANPATIVFSCNSIPSHDKAVYWFEVSINGKKVGDVEQNGVPSTFTTMVEKNELSLKLHMKGNNGNITTYPGKKQKIEISDGEVVDVLFENRRFTVNAGKK